MDTLTPEVIMRFVCMTQLKRNIRTGLVVGLVVAAVLALSYALYTRQGDIMDPNEQSGEPVALAQELGYSELVPPGISCRVRLCGTPKVEGRDVYLNLTNPAHNSYLLRAEIYTVKAQRDASTGQTTTVPDKLLGMSGFIHPGTYVEKVRLDQELKNGENPVYIKIALREEDTGHSGGFFYLGTTFVK